MFNYDDFVNAVKDGAKDLAKDLLNGFEDQAIDDAKQFLKKTEKDIKKWAKELEQNELKEQEFTDLVEAKKALAKIHALTQAGILEARLEEFRKGLIELVIKTVLSMI